MEVITTHLNADFDAMASMIAAKKLYPDALLVFSGSQERTLREFFVNATVFLYNFKRLRDLDLDGVTRLILVDTRQASRIGKFAEIVGRPDLEIHIYDHHPDAPDDIQGEMMVIRPVGATVTILSGLIRDRGLEVTPEEATILALGLYEDTGSFTFNSTTPEDFEAAAWLRKAGADLNLVADMVTRELSAEQVSLLSELLHSAKTFTIAGVEVCIASVSTDKYVGDFAVLVHKLKDMENLDVVFALAQMEDRIYLVARSRIPEVDAGMVTGYFGGGGHATAASATIRDLTLNQAEDKLYEVLKSVIKPSPTAGIIMSRPVIHVDASVTIAQAEEIMLRYGINAMPVMENGRLVGLLNRQVVEKAIFHGLRDRPARDYMSPEFMTVTPRATLLDIQEPLVENQQRILPVMEGDNLVGVITRKDLLNYLVSDRGNRPKALVEEPADSWPRRKTVISALNEHLPKDMIALLREFGDLADRLHYKAYAVGGFVRDLLLRRANLDVDIVVEGDGMEFARIFGEEHGVRHRTHRKFQTAVLIFPDGRKVDVATARMEYYQYPAALPIVEFGSLKMDLYRRDFTMNTLALSLNTRDFAQLVDFFGGQRDIKERVIRVLHNLSFVEDPTRILRAIRFEQRFGFRIGKQTLRLVRNAVQIGLIGKLGGQRLFRELMLILQEDDPLPALQRMVEIEVLAALSPELRLDQKREELFGNLREVISWYHLSFLDEALDHGRVFLMGLLSGLSPGALSSVCDRFGMDARHREELLSVFERIEAALREFFRLPNPRPSDIYRALQGFRPEELLFMMARTQREEARKLISHYFNRYRHVTTALRGRDLLAMGIPPGPFYRVLLDEVLDARLNGEVASREEEIARLRAAHPAVFGAAAAVS